MSDSINKFLIGFVIAILGAILAGVIAGQIILKTEYTVVGEEAEVILVNDTGPNMSVINTVTNAPTGWKTVDCPLTSIVVKPNSTANGGAALILDTDYNFTASTGTWAWMYTSDTVAMLVSDIATNTSYVDYSYCGDDYLNTSWGRNILKLTPGMFVIMILVAMIALLYTFIRVYKE